MTEQIRLRYVNRDHSHRLYGQVGTLLHRTPGRPRNQIVKLDSGERVCAPWGNWRRVKESGESAVKHRQQEWERARQGDTETLIELGKRYLGQE